MQTFDCNGLHVYPSNGISEARYQEVKAIIEKMRDIVTSNIKSYNINPLYYDNISYPLTPTIYISFNTAETTPKLALIEVSQGKLYKKCQVNIFNNITEKSVEDFKNRCNSYFRRMEKGLPYPNLKI